MKDLQELIKRVEVEINKTPTGELRNLLCDANIMLQQKALNIPVVSNRRELLIAFGKHQIKWGNTPINLRLLKKEVEHFLGSNL